jgi:hypothetical protein
MLKAKLRNGLQEQMQLTPQQVNQVYAGEADVLNIALFGMTAKQWRDTKLNTREYP